MTTDDPLAIPVDPHDYEHSPEPESDDEFVSLGRRWPEEGAGLGSGRGRAARASGRLNPATDQ